MAINISLTLIFAVFMIFLCSLSEGRQFNVGGRDGWVIKPSEGYNHWAERNRFQVNDTLLFKLKKGEDSVLEVTQQNYDACNVNNPIISLTEELSEYKFTRSGPHFFISGNSDHCNKGQKIIIVVLATRASKTPPTPTPVAPVVQSPPPPPTSVPSAQTPAPSTMVPRPEAGDVPSTSRDEDNKKSGAVFGASPLLGVGLSVVFGLGVFLVSGMVYFN